MTNPFATPSLKPYRAPLGPEVWLWLPVAVLTLFCIFLVWVTVAP